MSDSGFIFEKQKTRVPYYVLMKLEEEKICVLENTWGAARSKGIRVALATTFAGGWSSIMKETSKQSLKYGGSLWVFWFGIYFTNYKIYQSN